MLTFLNIQILSQIEPLLPLIRPAGMLSALLYLGYVMPGQSSTLIHDVPDDGNKTSHFLSGGDETNIPSSYSWGGSPEAGHAVGKLLERGASLASSMNLQNNISFLCLASRLGVTVRESLMVGILEAMVPAFTQMLTMRSAHSQASTIVDSSLGLPSVIKIMRVGKLLQ